MATEVARRELKGLTGRRKKKNRLDSHRPSHGRHCPLACKNACYLNLRNWSYYHGSFGLNMAEEISFLA